MFGSAILEVVIGIIFVYILASLLQPGANTPSATDDESGIDGCDVDIAKVTSDEDLPAAEGGVT